MYQDVTLDPNLDNDMVEVFPYIFISNWYSSNNPQQLKKNNIKAVVTVETNPKSPNILKYYKNNGIDFMYLYAADVPFYPIEIYFDRSYDFINKHVSRGQNVLIHCYAGVSRSSTIILNYIIRKLYEGNYMIKLCPCNVLKYALNIIREHRNIINPNKGFIKDLLLKAKEYQKKYGGKECN